MTTITFKRTAKTAIRLGATLMLGVSLAGIANAGPVQDFADANSCRPDDFPGQGHAYGLGSTQIIMGGVDDNYMAGNVEITYPRTELATVTNFVNYQAVHGHVDASRDYDEGHQNEFFLETLVVPNADKISKGWVLIKTSNFGGLANNDNVGFGNIPSAYTELANPTGAGGMIDFAKYTHFGSRVNLLPSQPGFQLDASTGIVSAALKDVQLYSGQFGGTATLLDQIKVDGFMDNYVQDDTRVDFVALVVCMKGNPDPNNNSGGNGNGNGNGNNNG